MQRGLCSKGEQQCQRRCLQPKRVRVRVRVRGSAFLSRWPSGVQQLG